MSIHDAKSALQSPNHSIPPKLRVLCVSVVNNSPSAPSFRPSAPSWPKTSPDKIQTLELDCGYRLEFLSEGQLVVEIKSVSELIPIFDAQILTYLSLGNLPVGLLMNFNAPILVNGLKRIVQLTRSTSGKSKVLII